MLSEGISVALWRIHNLQPSSHHLTSATHFLTLMIWCAIWEEGQKECWDLLENANFFCLVFPQFIRKQLASQGKNKPCHLRVELSRSPTVLSHVFLFIRNQFIRNQELASPKIKKLLELQIILPILNKELSLQKNNFTVILVIYF